MWRPSPSMLHGEGWLSAIFPSRTEAILWAAIQDRKSFNFIGPGWIPPAGSSFSRWSDCSTLAVSVAVSPLLVAGAGRISQRALARWLAKTAPKDGNSIDAKSTRATFERLSSRGLHHVGASCDRARRDRSSAINVMPGSQAPRLEPLRHEGRKRKILVQAVCNRNIAFHVGTVYLKQEDVLRQKVRRLNIIESKMLIATAEEAAYKRPEPSMVLGFCRVACRRE